LHHLNSSKKQWGQTMQNDLSDGVKWAIEQGIADANRVCIYGGSYGGYAVMAGLTYTPDLYKCGINYVGVTDLPLLFETAPDAWAAGEKQMAEWSGDRNGRRISRGMVAQQPWGQNPCAGIHGLWPAGPDASTFGMRVMERCPEGKQCAL
jgi:protease II